MALSRGFLRELLGSLLLVAGVAFLTSGLLDFTPSSGALPPDVEPESAWASRRASGPFYSDGARTTAAAAGASIVAGVLLLRRRTD